VLARLLVFGVAVCVVLPQTATPAARGYVFDGGTRAQRQVVVSALAASSFDWARVPGPVTIHIVQDARTEATPGHIWIDAHLLDAGDFAWGVVQHEYAHQVDYLLLNDGQRDRLHRLLGGRDWCYEIAGLPHAAHGCERFASTLAWAYWPSPDNCMRPESSRDESATLQPRRFRELLESMLESNGA
jgi:hypothetical protein